MRNERSVSRRVDEIDLGIFVFGVGQAEVESDFAGDGIFFVIRRGRAFVDLAPAGRGACDVEKGTNQLRLPCVAVSNDRKVANCFGSVDFHKRGWVLSEIDFRRQTSLGFLLRSKARDVTAV